MIRGYLLGFGLLQLAAVLLRASGLTHMSWAAILAPLWIGPALLALAAVAVIAAVLGVGPSRLRAALGGESA